jgi:hypothetical protein
LMCRADTEPSSSGDVASSSPNKRSILFESSLKRYREYAITLLPKSDRRLRRSLDFKRAARMPEKPLAADVAADVGDLV